MTATPRLIVGISGASGVTYGVRLLEILRDLPVETHLVMTKAAEVTLAHETGRKVAEVLALATRAHAVGDIADRMRARGERQHLGDLAPGLMRQRDFRCLGHDEMGLDREIAQDFQQPDAVGDARGAADADDEAGCRSHNFVPWAVLESAAPPAYLFLVRRSNRR